MRLLFITNSSFVKLGGLDFFPDRAWYNRHTAALCQRCRRLRPQRHSVGALARRARVPRGDQSDGPPAGAGVDRPPSPRPRRCHQRHHRGSPGNRKATRDRAGRRVRDHHQRGGPAHSWRTEPDKVARELSRIVDNLLEELDHWFSVSKSSRRLASRSRRQRAHW